MVFTSFRNVSLSLALTSLIAAASIAQEVDTAPAETEAPPAQVAEEPNVPAEPADVDAPPAETPPAEPAAPPADASQPPVEPPAPEASEAPADAVADAPAEEEVVEEAAAGEIDWAGLLERSPEFIAVLHHAAVHLPIALWIFGAFFVLVGLVIPSWRTQIPVACLVFGMLSAIPALLSGWWYAEFDYGDDWQVFDLDEDIVLHRWAAIGAFAVSVVLSILALVNLRKRSFVVGFIWRIGLIGLAVAIAWVGHIGGELTHGDDILEEAFQAWVNPEGE